VGGLARGFLRPSAGPRAFVRRLVRAAICLGLAVIAWGGLGLIVAGMRAGVR
jgi:hypothetical protein